MSYYTSYCKTVINTNISVCLFICIISMVFFYSCEKEVFVESKNSTEHVNYCSTYISSNPQGARIYIDNKYAGLITPDTVKWLSLGNHNVKLQFNNVLDTVFNIQTEYSAINSVFIDYFATFYHYGKIFCKSTPPSAEIYLNGSSTHQFTPDTLHYKLPGTYKVKLKREYFRDDSASVVVKGGVVSNIELTLQDTSEWIDYRVINSAIPSNNIMAFHVDNNNSIWIATYNSGLSKYTNQKFTNYTKSNSGLPGDMLTCIDVDADNSVWIGTTEGLAKYDGINWLNFNTQSGLPSNYITAIYCDNNRNTYVGTRMGLTLIRDSDVISDFMVNAPLLSNSIFSITGKSDGSLWVASVGGGKLLSE
jgi:hypothetical protein